MSALVDTTGDAGGRPVIELTNVRSYWNRLGIRPRVIAALVIRDDPDPYIGWWCQMSGGTRAAAENHVIYLRALIADLREHGYRPDAYRNDPRGLDFERDGFGPISVLKTAAGYIPRDGAHRACILRALGQPIPAVVWP